MPRISVVVPIYNVEGFLAECLESVAAQTVDDLEVVMVDDGSTDSSAAIAAAFAERDARFRLLSQPNGGLSKARNTGIEAADGEFLAFLDSDDVLPPNAYELLLGALEQTGSDFASGNVHRLTRAGTFQSPFLARAFARTRLKTHVSRDRALLADRVAWNKLWRRSFWDEHAKRFPVGVVHEDIPVVLPAHFKARAVDVIADPVYLWRTREGGELSITQRRLEPRVLLDRLAAIEQVSDYLAEHGPRRARRWYHASVVADDLSYHLNILDSADEAYRELFLERVNAFLDRAGKRIYAPLPAIDRLKWHLVRRRLMPELLEILRFEREDMSNTPPVRVRGRWYGDYPFRTDRRLAIPRSVYRLRSELALAVHLEELRRDGDRLKIRGFAYIEGIGAATPGSQKIVLTALRPGPLRSVRLRTTARRLPTTSTNRPDATANSRQALSDLAWAGFEATVGPRALRARGRSPAGTWELYANARAGGVRRRRGRFVLEAPVAAVDLPGPPGAIVKAAASSWGRLTVDVRTQWLVVRAARAAGEAIELSGDARVAAGGKPKLELVRRGDALTRSGKLTIEGERFTARVPLRALRSEDSDDERVMWELWAVLGGRRLALALPADGGGAVRRSGNHEIALQRTRQGDAALVERDAAPLLTDARWTGDGVLEVTGTLPPQLGWQELVLADENRGGEHAFEIAGDGAPAGGDGAPATGDGERFRARLTPARIESLAGPLPVVEGTWRVCARRADGALVPALLDRALAERLPLQAIVERKPFALAAGREERAVLIVRRDLGDHERGPYHQRRLRATAYAERRSAPVRDAVVYSSFGGRQYSDSPRAIHEELVRRDAPLEHLWVVRDGQCRPPETATVLREGSREYHEALATARFVVTNDHFPDWFARRPDQVCVQTWHGTPLKRLGLDVSDMRRTIRRFQRRWDQQVANWQYVISPNRFSTPILQRAYAIEGELLETGYPRVDVLARPDRDVLARRLRQQLGLPDDVRTVLYAPTYRDDVVDRRGRFRLDLRLDLDRLRDAVGADTVLLFRKHHYIPDAVPTGADGFVRDVSSYPDGTELLLAADVLVTDYSSMMVDYANTGRPMLFFTYDLDAYRDEIRGFYLDFVATAPGPLLRTTDDVADALRDLDGVRAAHAERYDAFRRRFCELDDGHAAARVVDRTFSW